MSITKVTGMMQTGTKGGDIPSAGTMVIDTDGDYFDITGTTGITGMTVAAGRRFTLQFDGAVTITDNAAITLSGAANFTTAAGDILSFIAVAANTVVQTGYSLVDGGSPVAPSGGDTVTQFARKIYIHDLTASTGTVALTGVGFVPQLIMFICNKDQELAGGIGFSTGSGANNWGWYFEDDSTETSGNANSYFSYYWSNTGGHYKSFAVNSLDADGFTVGWAKTGTVTGSYYIEALCFRFIAD